MLILYQSSTSFPKSWGIPRRGALFGEISTWGVEKKWQGFLPETDNLPVYLPVKTIGRHIISRDSTVWGTSGKIWFFHDSTHKPFSNKPPQGLRIRNIEQVKGFETRIFLVKRRPSQTYQQNAWVRCWSCNLRYQITMRSDNMNARL